MRFIPKQSHFLPVSAILGAFMLINSVSTSHINNNMPKICEALHVSLSTGSWVANIEFIVAIITATMTSRLGERFGAAQIYTLGTAIYCIANLSLGIYKISTDFAGVLMMRALSSIGVGLAGPSAMPLGMTLIPQKITQFIAVCSVGITVGSVMASFFAGIVAENLGWQYMAILVGILAFFLLVFALIKLPFNLPTNKMARLDIPGTALLSIGLVGSVLCLNSLGKTPIMPRWLALIILAVCAVVLVVFFVYNSRWSRHPIFSRQLWSRQFILSELVYVIGLAASYGERYIDPFIFKAVLKCSLPVTGYFMAVGGLAGLIFSPIVNALTKRLVTKNVLLITLIFFSAVEAFAAFMTWFFPNVPGSLVCQVCTLGGYVALLIVIQACTYGCTPKSLSGQVGVANQLCMNLSHSLGITLAVLFQGVFDGGKYTKQCFGAVLLTLALWASIAIGITAFMQIQQRDRGKIGFSERIAMMQGVYEEDMVIDELIETEEFEGDVQQGQVDKILAAFSQNRM